MFLLHVQLINAVQSGAEVDARRQMPSIVWSKNHDWFSVCAKVYVADWPLSNKNMPDKDQGPTWG
jgi:hypothetical protein